MDDFDVCAASPVAYWEAFATAAAGSVVIHDSGYVAAHFADPVLNNAIVWTAAAVTLAGRVHGTEPHALWTSAAEADMTKAPRAAAYKRVTTRPMLLRLDRAQAERTDSRHRVLRGVEGPPHGATGAADPARVAVMNSVAPALVRGVPGLRAYASAGSEPGLFPLDLGTDVNISFVTTVPAARRRGLARAVLAVALGDAVERGLTTASLQATDMAETLSARAGFVPVGRWQEVPERTNPPRDL